MPKLKAATIAIMMISWQLTWQLFKTLSVSLMWIINAFVISSANLQPIMVTSNISTGEIVCPGDIVVFTCTTRGSAIISWTGDDYVGDQIGFNTANMVNETRHGSTDPNTVAMLINNTFDTTPVLVSQLQITVSTVSSNQSVICIHNSDGIRRTVAFQVTVGPGRPNAAAHLTGDTTRGCTLHISWIVPDETTVSDIKHFMIFIDGVNVHNETNPKNATFLSLSYLIRTCTPHNTSVSIVNRCDRVGPSSPTVMTFSPEPLVCDDTVCEESTVTGNCSNQLTAVFATLFGITAGVMAVSIVLNIILVLCLKKKNKIGARRLQTD